MPGDPNMPPYPTMPAYPTEQQELGALRDALSLQGPGWIEVQAPLGSGKTELLRRALADRDALVLQAAPLGSSDMLADFRVMLMDRLGELPRPRGPGVLPDPGGIPGWRTLFLGLVDWAQGRGRPLILALDGWDTLASGRKRLPRELAEALERAEARSAPFRVVLTMEAPHGSRALVESFPEPLAVVRLGPLPLREAARAQGGVDPRDAFLRWACLGGHRAHLPSAQPGATWENAVVDRVLRPLGDLHDAPLHRLRSSFHRPERYGSLARALAAGPLDWSEVLARTRGIGAGGQMAPYLKRLEEEGLMVTERPLGADPASRNRRYRLADPFWAFWMECVLPVRSRLLTDDPRRVWEEAIRPRLPTHLTRWLPRATAEWFRRHAAEALPAPGREVGAFWGGEAEFAVIAWLTNGQVCYVEAAWTEGEVGGEVYDDLARRMDRTRYGIGREARAPVLVLTGPASEALRRQVARNPLARILTLDDLMGSDWLETKRDPGTEGAPEMAFLPGGTPHGGGRR